MDNLLVEAETLYEIVQSIFSYKTDAIHTIVNKSV